MSSTFEAYVVLALLFFGGFAVGSRDNFDIFAIDPSMLLCSVRGVEGVSESLVYY
jgi:hypothetical protein